MAVKIGSARVDERGKYSGGKAGSQIDKEISIQDWYLHSKGWIVIRPKNLMVAEKIAEDMEYACESKYVGYDQGQNTTLYNAVKSLDFDISKLRVMCETDCARLVRVCVKYAGVDVADFYTGNEVDALKATGEFEILTSDKYCKSSDYLKRGDILVTKTKGHTVVVLSYGAKIPATEPAAATNIHRGQNWLNENYGAIIKKITGELLDVDGKCGTHSRWAALIVWKDLMNRKYDSSLTLSNKNFGDTCKKYASNAVVKKGTEGTFTYICQFILSAKKFYKGEMDGKCGSDTESAIKEFQESVGLSVDGHCGKNTWYKLFN